MPHLSPAARGTAVLGLACCLTLAACGDDPMPAGPDVTGLNLVDARADLKKANVAFTEHAQDALLGIIVPSNFVVCDVAYVSKHKVRLEVAKNGCKS